MPLNEDYIGSIKRYLQKIQSDNKKQLFQSIVDTPFADALGATSIDLGIIVILLVDKSHNTINRIALSKTHMAKKAVEMSAKPFKKILIPLGYPSNIIAVAIESNKIQETSDWQNLFIPALTPRQANLNQSGAGIECSIVSPLKFQDGGAMIFSFYQPLKNLEPDSHYKFVKQYSQLTDQILNRHRHLF